MTPRVFAVWLMVAAASLAGISQGKTVLIAAAAYPEGPLWRDGKLLYVEYAGPGIKIWDGSRAAAYWRGEHCGASGLISYRRNHLLVACYDMNAIVELDENGKQIRVIDKDGASKPFIGPNDFTADGAGGIYFSASGIYDLKAPISGTILHLAPGTDTLVEVANLIHYSNGLTLAKDGKNLLVAEMLAGRILSFPIGAGGTWKDTTPRHGPRCAHDDPRDQMACHLATRQGQDLYRHRAPVSEGGFADLKERTGLRQFAMRGITRAQGELLLACAAANIHLLYRRTRLA